MLCAGQPWHPCCGYPNGKATQFSPPACLRHGSPGLLHAPLQARVFENPYFPTSPLDTLFWISGLAVLLPEPQGVPPNKLPGSEVGSLTRRRGSALPSFSSRLNQRSVCRVHKEIVLIPKAFLLGTPLPAEPGCPRLLGSSRCMAILSSHALLS